MILKIFSIHDSKAEAFVQPFFAPTTGLAIRSFGAAANDTASDFYKYAEDYTLFELGEFDQLTAQFQLLPAPKALGVALSFITNTDTDEREVDGRAYVLKGTR